MVTRLALAADTTPGAEGVCVLNLDSGEAVPIRLPAGVDAPFDRGLGRRGWVAAHVGYDVVAFVDGADMSAPVPLPQAWQVLPAATDDQVLIKRYFGDSILPGEGRSMAVLGPDGRTRRSVELPPVGLDEDAAIVGEVEAGVVTRAEIGGWDGAVTALPVACVGDPLTDPMPFGVLAGRVILFEGVDYVESVDLADGSRVRVAVPPKPRRFAADPRWTSSTQYNAAGTWMVAAEYQGGCVVAGSQGQLRHLDRSVAGYDVAWMWCGDRLLMFDKPSRGTVAHDPLADRDGTTPMVEYDPVNDTVTELNFAPMDWGRAIIPKIDITGRFTWPPGQ